MKYVRDTAAGKSIGAWIVLNPKGEHVANIQAHFADSGAVTVDVFHQGDGPNARTARAMGYELDDAGKIATGKHAGEWPYKVAQHQQGRATGYGYDKFAAALAGLYVDGHLMTDHASHHGAPKPPKGRKLYPEGFKVPKGYTLANYGRRDTIGGEEGYMSCFRETGERYLQALGYRVLKAI